MEEYHLHINGLTVRMRPHTTFMEESLMNFSAFHLAFLIFFILLQQNILYKIQQNISIPSFQLINHFKNKQTNNVNMVDLTQLGKDYEGLGICI